MDRSVDHLVGVAALNIASGFHANVTTVYLPLNCASDNPPFEITFGIIDQYRCVALIMAPHMVASILLW